MDASGKVTDQGTACKSKFLSQSVAHVGGNLSAIDDIEINRNGFLYMKMGDETVIFKPESKGEWLVVHCHEPVNPFKANTILSLQPEGFLANG